MGEKKQPKTIWISEDELNKLGRIDWRGPVLSAALGCLAAQLLWWLVGGWK